MISFIKSFEELQDIFMVHLKEQNQIRNYPAFFFNTRRNLIKWVVEICDKLQFKDVTLHRTICLFDSFISITQGQMDYENNHEIKLAVIACLSIATKLNELNYNCNSYFTEHILKGKKNNYTNQDLAKKEIQILMIVNYETSHSNVYHFNTIFTLVALDQLKSAKNKEEFLKVNDAIVKQYILSDYCVKMSPVNSCIFILNSTLKHFAKSINIPLIINSIEKLNSKNKNCTNI